MATILIVEDDPLVQKFYTILFKEEKYTIHLAVDGVEGVEKAKEITPDIILMDIMMPRKNGIDALKDIKADPKLAQIPVVMLTNFGEQEFVKQSTEAGASAFIIKADVSPRQLITEVRKYVGAPDS